MNTTEIQPNTTEYKMSSVTTRAPQTEVTVNGTSMFNTTEYLANVWDDPMPSYRQNISTRSCDCNKGAADDSSCLDAGTVVGLVIASFVMGIIVTFITVGLIWKRSKLLNQRLKDTRKNVDSSLIRTATYKKRLTSDYTYHGTKPTEKISEQKKECPSLVSDPKSKVPQQECKGSGKYPGLTVGPEQMVYEPSNITDSIYSCAREVKEQSDKLKAESIYCNTPAKESIYSNDTEFPFPESQREEDVYVNNNAASSDLEAAYINNETPSQTSKHDIEAVYTNGETPSQTFEHNIEAVYTSDETPSQIPAPDTKAVYTNNETPSQIPEHDIEAIYTNEETASDTETVNNNEETHSQNVEAVYINQNESDSQGHGNNTGDAVVKTTEKMLARKDSNVYNHLGDILENESTIALYDHAPIANQNGMHGKQRRKPQGSDDANPDLYDHAISENRTTKQREAYEEVDLVTEDSNLESRTCDENSKHGIRTDDAQHELSQNVTENEYFILEPQDECNNNPLNRTVITESMYFELEMTS